MCSIIIRNKNERSFLGRAIQSVVSTWEHDFASSKPGPCSAGEVQVEVIVVDDSSTDESVTLVKLAEQLYGRLVTFTLIILDADTYTPGLALNRGVRSALHPVVLLLSAHCELLPGTLRTGIDFLAAARPKCEAVFGQQIPAIDGIHCLPLLVNEDSIFQHFSPAISTVVVNMKASGNEADGRFGGYFFHNAFAFYKKQALAKFPFDEQVPGKEDRYWAAACVCRGSEYSYVPELKCVHHQTNAGATWIDASSNNDLVNKLTVKKKLNI